MYGQDCLMRHKNSGPSLLWTARTENSESQVYLCGARLEIHTEFARKWLVEKSNWTEGLGMKKSLAWFWLRRTDFYSRKA